MRMDTYTGIVKPHYRLLGMLLERRELRAELSDRLLKHHDGRLQNDLAIVELEHQIESLDTEIRAHQSDVWQHYLAVGRSLAELRAFIGDDLMDELVAISGPGATELL